MAALNWPNRISLARIALIVPFVICLLNVNEPWTGWRYVALVLFVLMALSDALDGFLARRLNESTPLGRYLDPVGDKLLITSAVILLSIDATAVPGFHLPNWVPVIAIGKDVLTVIGFLVVFAATGHFHVQPRIMGKACTVVQLIMIGYGLAAPDMPVWLHRLWPILWWLASGVAIVALADYVRVGTRFVTQHHATPNPKR